MSDFDIQINDDLAVVSGELGFANASQVLAQHPTLENVQRLDVSKLTSVDSAGLSVLLHWQRAAVNSNPGLKLTGLSSQLRSLIEIAGLQVALPTIDPWPSSNVNA